MCNFQWNVCLSMALIKSGLHIEVSVFSTYLFFSITKLQSHWQHLVILEVNFWVLGEQIKGFGLSSWIECDASGVWHTHKYPCIFQCILLFVLVWGVCITYFGSLTKFLDSLLDYWLFESFSHLLFISFISLVGLSPVFCSVLCQFSLLVVSRFWASCK